MKPLISYYGGKQRIASQIVPHLDAIPHTVYAEPFAGGLAVLFAKHRPQVSNNHHYLEAINDISEDLINLYRVAREQPAEFERWMQLTPYSQAEHRKAIEILRNPESSEWMKAWAYYVNIQQSFANTLNAGWRASVYGRNQAATWDVKRKRIPECLERLADVHIACEDALRFIERWDSPQTLFYVDPPYPGSEQGHYDGYTLDDWAALCDALDNAQCSYVLSNYPQDIEPASAQRRIEIAAVVSSNGNGKVGKGRDKSRGATADEMGDRTRTEVLWICDRSEGMRSELSKPVLAHRYNQLSFA